MTKWKDESFCAVWST